MVIRDSLPLPDTNCNQPSLSHVHTNYVLNAAYGHLVTWTLGGPPPPSADRIQLSSPTVAIRDAFGNALGGIRLAEHAVATATNTGVNSGSSFCSLYGTHIPFSPQLLAQLYPTHDIYFNAVVRTSKLNVRNGYLLMPELILDMIDAGNSNVGN